MIGEGGKSWRYKITLVMNIVVQKITKKLISEFMGILYQKDWMRFESMP